ncbi:MAG: hypothetical protein U9R48_01630 [Chloroflexota bacterium]|nr:hypothetical protein [Chloroflexota bacterium]
MEEIARKARGEELIPMERSTEHSSRIIGACEFDTLCVDNGRVTRSIKPTA